MKKCKPVILSILGAFICCLTISAQSEMDQLDEYEAEVVDTVYSKILEENRVFWVKFPEGYDPQNAQKYPVVYLRRWVLFKKILGSSL